MEDKQTGLVEMSREIIALKKQVEQMEEFIVKDLKFAIRTELAWQSHDKGEFTSYSKDEFLKKLEKW